MNPNRQLQGSFWLMIAIQTITAIDMPGRGRRKLPAPRAYVAAIVTWSILGLIADAGGEKAAAAMGWVMVLVGMVLGTMGKTLTDFLNTIADQFAIPKPPTGPPAQTGTGKTEVNPARGTPTPPRTRLA